MKRNSIFCSFCILVALCWGMASCDGFLKEKSRDALPKRKVIVISLNSISMQWHPSTIT